MFAKIHLYISQIGLSTQVKKKLVNIGKPLIFHLNLIKTYTKPPSLSVFFWSHGTIPKCWKNIASERRLVVSSLGLRGKSPVPQRRATG